MSTSSLKSLSYKFQKTINKYSQSSPEDENIQQIQQNNVEEEVNLNNVANELNSVVEQFIANNPLKMATTRRPFIREEQDNENAAVGVGFIIPFTEFDEYIKKLNNEIQKLKQKYPDITLYGYYDEKDARKAKL